MKKRMVCLFAVIFPLAFSLLVAGQVNPRPVAVAEASRVQKPVPVAEPTNVKKNIETNIRDLENKWNDAVLKHDVATMSLILAEDVIDTASTGHVQGKAEDLADLKSGEPKLESSSVDDMKVRVYGTVAVVNGHYTQKGSYKGKDITGEGRFTDVFIERQGQWQCVSTQGTPISKE